MHPVRHAGHGVRRAVQNRQLCDHRLVRGQLIFAAEGHQDRRRADGRIEPLAQALLGADIEVAKHIRQLLRHRIARKLVGLDIIIRDRRSRVLLRAVGIEELAGQIDNRHALPRHAQTGFGGHFRHDGRFKVLAVCRRKERVNILRRKHNRHPLLRFGNRQLRAVQTVVLLRHFVQINQQAVRQFADCHGYAARAEVVAALDEPGDFAVAEEALELAFGWGIALLHLRAARFDGFQLMGLGRTRCAAAAVAPGAPAEQDNLVAGGGHFAADVLLRRSAHHRTDFQTLGGIARMVHFVHQPRRQSNLVAIGGIARRRRGDELALGQFSRHGLADRNERVSRAGHAHCLIDVGAPGQRVANRTADAGRRAAEGLNLRGVVVRLILEHEQPRLFHAVHIHINLDGAGIDFLAHVNVGGLPDFL